jgi:hypothetical protein
MNSLSILKRVTTFGLMLAIASTAMAQQTVDTRIGKLEFTHDFENGYPTDKTIAKLYDEMDFQRATQAYIWAIPIVSAARWHQLDREDHGAKLGDIIIRSTFDERLGMLTINNDTFYAAFDLHLDESGPTVIEIPQGIDARGSALDMWQRPIADMAKSGKYLFMPPGAKELKDTKGFTVLKSPQNGVVVAIRLFAKTDKEKEELSKKVLIYPYSKRNNPPKESRLIYPKTSPISAPPRGMEYWKLLADIINKEPVEERDRFMMAMLKRLGIEKGKPFKPDARQTKILTEAVLVGEAMAKANWADRQMKSAFYRKGSNWEIATTTVPDQRAKYYDELDGRAAWFYEAVLNNVAMHSYKPGKTQVYLGGYRDSDGDFLDGGTNYVLNVPANPPQETFWSVTVYDVSHRTMISTDQKKPTVGSIQGFDKNADGSISIYFGPDAPKGKEKNWIKTIPGQGWFSYFRLYSPTKPFFDGSWVLPDFEKRK